MDADGGGGEEKREGIEDVGEVGSDEKRAGEEDEDEDEKIESRRW